MLVNYIKAGRAISLVLAILLSIFFIQALQASDHAHNLVPINGVHSSIDPVSDTGCDKLTVCCSVCVALPQLRELSSLVIDAVSTNHVTFHQLVGRNEAPDPFPPKYHYYIN